MFEAATFSGRVEFRDGFKPRSQPTHVIFDFDGTLSWLRHGWPQIMLALFREDFPVQAGERESDVDKLLMREILALNGRPSIFQIERFVELSRQRGGTPPMPDVLLEEYSRRLESFIFERTEQMRRGESFPDEFVIHGARKMIELLLARGIKLVILSGTLEPRVRQEAALLNLSSYFGAHIYGSTPDASKFSKRAVIDRLLAEEQMDGPRLLSFGDGPVEIAETKAVGGMAIAVASDEEHNGSGNMDAFKHDQLLAAGADAVIPDYRDAAVLLDALFLK